MSSSHQFAIMSLHAGQKDYHEVCTNYLPIEPIEMNEKGNDFNFYNKPYMPSVCIHGPLHMVCTLSLAPLLL